MRYLFVSSHSDDVELAAGGTISKLKEGGHKVTVITLSHIFDGVNLTQEWIHSMETLNVDGFSKMGFDSRKFNTQYDDILQYLFRAQKENYDFIFVPSSKDLHLDHETVGKICERVFKHDNLITYVHPWNTREYKANYYVKLESHHVEAKIRALQCYESQQHRIYFNYDYTWSNAVANGVVCNSPYAESFQVVNYNQ